MSKRGDDRPVVRANEWGGPQPIREFLKDFSVYPDLTARLDARTWTFTQGVINEIVLWKVARYVNMPSDLLRDLDRLRSLKPGQESQGESVIKDLLLLRGVRLPMASTFLRFANPEVFQIFDRHMYRAIYGTVFKPLSKKHETCWPLYRKYLGDLRGLCGAVGITFSDSDRILFEFDKAVNPPLSKTDGENE